MKTKWTLMQDRLVKTFIHKNQPEMIYVIKTGFEDKWIVVHEDAHEITLGNTFIGTKEEVENKYEIEL